ncbi:protein of unknown function DUF1023 [Segniliparus rotundus DSM 44985]|uniref:DUF1023 domain-containing protein n=1 Tax=Segniliparus rotundus (strain ATCC BAA-972 / CDC 1076 / CIP 108378 / DSM 44985 / JCM 13578) TaxID=640132 RepID=D6ZCN6_SEGRD|nr:alpha/beta hydrolase [Segniliparus rotundus]ADG97078.1 protein of unknown function DUF1023 [Segniliparus rotundus DSM 44985]
MGEFTMSQIASWRPETLIAGADEAKAHNTRLLGILDGIKDATNRMAGESSGAGETARFDFIDRTTKFGYSKHELMVQHQQLVEEAGYDLKAKADRVLTEAQAARKAGLVVWDDGQVSGEVPRQREELEKYTASIGEAKHALEQADREHARKIRELNDKIKEGTEGGYREADYFQKFGNLKDEPLDPDKAAKERAGRIADGKEPLPTDPKELNEVFKHLHGGKDGPDGDKSILAELYRRYPEIGNKPGFPFENRDYCNRLHLNDLKQLVRDEIQRLQNEHPDWKTDQIPGYKENPHMPPGFNEEQKQAQQLNNPEWNEWKTRIAEMQHRLDGYNNLQATLDKTTLPKALGGDGLPRFLSFLDDKGHTAVTIGDADHATKVATFVPGTGQDMTKMTGSDDYSARLYTEALNQGKEHGIQPTDISVTTWMCYDRPMDIFDPTKGSWAGDPKFALDGAQALDDWQSGLRFSHDDANLGRAYQTVIGHSYGSVEVGAAASNGHHLDADAMVGVGSPGMIGNSAHDMNINQGGEVYIATADNDMIRVATTLAPIGDNPLGNDPSTWGDATQFQTDPGKKGDGWLTGDLSGDAHGSYFQPNSTGLKNMGRIIVGREPEHK